MNDNGQYILTVEGLKTCFEVEREMLPAVDGVTFAIRRGSTLALVGESGCGKSVTAFSTLRLIQKPGRIVAGRIRFFPSDGSCIDVTSLSEKSPLLYRLRGGLVGMIFQEPMTALSPVHKVGNQICEALLIHKSQRKKTAKQACLEMLKQVGIANPADTFNRYPHEISGGMRQRVVIAMALVCRPALLIADEPTTALDVTIQAQILALISRLQKELGISVLLITHDIGVVAQVADEVAVMYLGKIVEHAPVRELIRRPRHPYTMALIKSLPSTSRKRERLVSIEGSVPSLTDIPAGCPFHPRCHFAKKETCFGPQVPQLEELTPQHKVACLRADEIIAL